MNESVAAGLALTFRQVASILVLRSARLGARRANTASVGDAGESLQTVWSVDRHDGDVLPSVRRACRSERARRDGARAQPDSQSRPAERAGDWARGRTSHARQIASPGGDRPAAAGRTGGRVRGSFLREDGPVSCRGALPPGHRRPPRVERRPPRAGGGGRPPRLPVRSVEHRAQTKRPARGGFGGDRLSGGAGPPRPR